MFEQLDFIYQPSRDAAADLEHYVHCFGAEPVSPLSDSAPGSPWCG